MRKNLNGAYPHIRLMVRNALVLAELRHQLVHLAQIMPRQHGEKVVVHLILQSAAKPVNKEVRRDVACSGDLQLPEIWTLIGRID